MPNEKGKFEKWKNNKTHQPNNLWWGKVCDEKSSFHFHFHFEVLFDFPPVSEDVRRFLRWELLSLLKPFGQQDVARGDDEFELWRPKLLLLLWGLAKALLCVATTVSQPTSIIKAAKMKLWLIFWLWLTLQPIFLQFAQNYSPSCPY